MTRRLVLALLAAATLAVVLFAVPLAVQAYRLEIAQAELRLERDATAAAGQVPHDYRSSGDPVELPEPDTDQRIALYTPDGRRLLGTGPDRADPLVSDALAGTVGHRTANGRLSVAVPVSADEQVIGAVRIDLPLSQIRADTARTWGLMTLAAIGALALTGLVGWRLATRMTRPVVGFADTARRIGDGDFTARADRSPVPELDRAAASLNETAERLGELVRRERTFTADASHQLNTPLTRLRLTLEQAQADHGSAHLDRALAEVDAMSRLVDDLLRLARDTQRHGQPVRLEPILAEIEDRWHGTFAGAARPLRRSGDPDRAVIASPTTVDQVLDVLLDNALRHGDGEVTVTVRPAGAAVAVDVSDEGPGVDPESTDVFARRSADARGHGIGLALARALAEADGGRLELRDPGPGPTFTLLLPAVPAAER